jgi:hypothetical protein
MNELHDFVIYIGTKIESIALQCFTHLSLSLPSLPTASRGFLSLYLYLSREILKLVRKGIYAMQLVEVSAMIQ